MGVIDRLSAGSAPKSITKRIRSLTLLISGLCVLFALTIFAIIDIIDFRRSTQENLVMLAEIAAYNSIGALSFSDNDAAASVLSSLQANSHIQFAGLYTVDGQLFEKRGSSTLQRNQIDKNAMARKK